MTKKFHWDIVHILTFLGAILGIIFHILIFINIWAPVVNLVPAEWYILVPVIIVCCFIIVGYGVIGWDIGTRASFFFLLAFGIILILFGNLAGIALIVAAIPLPFSH